MEPIVVGIDFENTTAQISCYHKGMKEPETMSAITGREQYAIPIVLCKQKEKNRWFYGEEAKKMALKGEGLLITDILQKAVAGESMELEGEVYSYLQLLVIFLRKMWNGCMENPGETKILACMISVEELTGEVIDLLYEVAEFLPLDSENVYFQSHGESFYYYGLLQSRLEGKKAEPALVITEHEGVFSFLYLEYRNNCARLLKSRREITAYGRYASTNEEEKDRMFLELIQAELTRHPAKLLYLIGDFFEGSWMKTSLEYICRNRRAFIGSNLFSKGCAYAAYRKVTKEKEPWLYLGEDRLKREIVLQLPDDVCRLSSLGDSWYEADGEIELILEETDRLEFLIRDEKETVQDRKVLILDGLPVRQGYITTVLMELYFESPAVCKIQVTDEGFGDITPSGGGHWEITLNLDAE